MIGIMRGWKRGKEEWRGRVYMLRWMGCLEDGGGLDTVDLLGGGLCLGEEFLSLEGSDTAGACMT